MLRNLTRAAEPVAVDAPSEPTAAIFPVVRLRHTERVLNEAAIRALCLGVYLGEHTALCRVLGRYKMYVDCRDIGIAPHLMLDGYWELWVTEALVSLVEEGMVVADIGANLGYFSLLLADLVGPAGQVHAFEPNPHMAALLHRSLAVNGMADRVHVHQLALGVENAGDVALIVPPEDPKNAQTVPMNDVRAESAVIVPLARLDGRPDWATIEFAKIDVEGAEQLIWAGAQGLLDDGMLKVVMLEFTADRYTDPAGFLAALMAPGFSLAYVHVTEGIIDVAPSEILEFAAHLDIMLVLRR